MYGDVPLSKIFFDPFRNFPSKKATPFGISLKNRTLNSDFFASIFRKFSKLDTLDWLKMHFQYLNVRIFVFFE